MGKEEEKQPPVARRVNTGSGSMVVYSELPNRKRLWNVRWEKARLEYTGEADYAGEMETVKGSLYRQGAEASRFAAQRGEGDKRRQRLVLTGQVRLDANDPEVTIFCDRVEWLAGRELVRATGNVRVEGPWGAISPMPEVLATPDLKRVGTPEAFGALGSGRP